MNGIILNTTIIILLKTFFIYLFLYLLKSYRSLIALISPLICICFVIFFTLLLLLNRFEALSCLWCTDVPLINYSLTHLSHFSLALLSLSSFRHIIIIIIVVIVIVIIFSPFLSSLSSSLLLPVCCYCHVPSLYVQFSLKGQFKPIAEEEVTRLQEFARSEGFTDRLQMWDLPYWRRRQKQHLFRYFIFILRFSV